MILVEKHIIKHTNAFYKELDDLCFKSKNLYNSGLYLIRQNFFNKISNNVSWININNQFVNEKQTDYYALPSKVSQQTLKMVEQNMKSFFSALKAKNSKPKLPKYLDKVKGRLIVTYTNQAISKTELKKGFIKLSQTNVRIKTNVRDVQQVRVVPKNGFIVIEILYNKENMKPFVDNGRKCAADLGLNNLMTCVEKHETYTGKCIKRGLFKSSQGRLINADVNGAYNIMKKVVGNVKFDPILACSTPLSFGTIS